MRSAILIVLIGACLILLLLAAEVCAGVMLLSALRREREDAQRKTDFIDNVSHELKTPLAGIRLNAELLSGNMIPDEERRRCALAAIIAEADRLARMVSELLDFSRLEKGSRSYSIETFDLASYATEASVEQMVSAFSNGRARISVKGPGVLVSADKDAIMQIGTNLISNAVKYSEGEIEIEVDGLYVRFMDRGKGVPRGSEERIFERFYRGDESLTRNVGGSGLGLCIARALARGMGGDITYAHRPGGGSVFTLALAPANHGNGGSAK